MIIPGIPMLFPTAKLMQMNANLRLRHEINTDTGERTQCDFNEKTLMGASQKISGISNRDEREMEMEHGESFESGYNRFVDAYRHLGSPTYTDKVKFKELAPSSGIVTARNTYALAVVHPNHPVMFIYEVCEDRFDTLQENLIKKTASLHEWECEPKQVIGKLPLSARTPAGFQNFVYTAMDAVGDYLVSNIHGARHNEESKAEIAAGHIRALYGDCDFLSEFGITHMFNGAGQSLSAHQFALMNSAPLQQALTDADRSLFNRAARLKEERDRYTEDFSGPDIGAIGAGARILNFDAKRRQQAPSPIILAA